MSLKKTAAVIVAVLSLAACEEWENGAVDDGPHPLIGTWRNVSMEVYVDAREDGRGVRAISVDADSWVDTLGLQPPETRFTADGLYETIYLDSQGHEVERMSGYWLYDGDEREQITLVQVEPEPEQRTYHLTMQGSLRARMETWVDWNSNGTDSDRYIGVQERLRTGEARAFPPEE